MWRKGRMWRRISNEEESGKNGMKEKKEENRRRKDNEESVNSGMKEKEKRRIGEEKTG